VLPIALLSHLSIPSADHGRDARTHRQGSWRESFKAASFGASALVACRSATRQEQQRRRNLREVIVRQRASKSSDTEKPSAKDEEVEQATAALEASRLQVEAARIKTELEELERINKEKQRTALAERLLSGSQALTVLALKDHLDKDEGIPLSDEEVESLMLAVKQKPGSAKETGSGELTLAFEEIASEAFEAEVKRLKVQQRDEEVSKFLEKQKKEQKKLEIKKREEEIEQEAAAGPGPDDTSIATKVLSTLAYLLPLADAVQLLVPLMQEQPLLALPVAPLILANLFVSSIPLGNFLLIIIFGIAARNATLPRLLRFNLEQAVLVCIVYQAPVLLYAMAVYFDPTLAPALGAACFGLLVVLVGYCVARISSGRLPDELPLVSNAAKNFMDRGGFW